MQPAPDDDKDDIKLEDDPEKEELLSPRSDSRPSPSNSAPRPEEEDSLPSPGLEYFSDDPDREEYSRAPSPNPSEMDSNVEFGEERALSPSVPSEMDDEDVFLDFTPIPETWGPPNPPPRESVIPNPRDTTPLPTPDQRMSSPLPELTKSPSPVPRGPVRFMDEPETTFDPSSYEPSVQKKRPIIRFKPNKPVPRDEPLRFPKMPPGWNIREEDWEVLDEQIKRKLAKEFNKKKAKLFNRETPESRARMRNPDTGEPTLRRSKRAPAPRSLEDNIYGNKTPAEIEAEISRQRDELVKLLKRLKSSKDQMDVDPKNIQRKRDMVDMLIHITKYRLNISTLTETLHNKKLEALSRMCHEGSDEFTSILLAQAISREEAQSYQYRDIIKIQQRDPTLFSQWKDAMIDEIKSLENRDIWELTDLPKGRTPIKCRWVFDVKSDGRKKARLVVKGFSQRPGTDYGETFSPVARYESIRMLLAMSVLEKWDIEALDVKTAFLYGNLDEEIYMTQPEGFIVKGQENKVYRLKKALYGLKQASYAWNKQADKSLKSLGFKCARSDSGIYVKGHGKSIIICIIYVDDVLFMGPELRQVQKVKEAFMKLWECRDLGRVKEYLGMRINYDHNKATMIIDQHEYAKKIVKRFGQENAKSVRTPLPTGQNVTLPHIFRSDTRNSGWSTLESTGIQQEFGGFL